MTGIPQGIDLTNAVSVRQCRILNGRDEHIEPIAAGQ